MSDEISENLVVGQSADSGSDEEIRMLLGGRENIRKSGIIRAGKQVPINKCTPQEKALFAKLEAEGVPYDEINRQMGGKPKSRDSKLTMTNTDYFVLRECDFKKQSDLEFILNNYADADGKVRRIPVFFTVSDIDKAIPHGYKAFNGSQQVRCYSFYDGDDLKFKYLEKSVANPKPTDWKVLDSDDDEEASKVCGYPVSFKGMFRLNVVGLRGISECFVPNSSWYGMGDAVAVLRKIKKRLGRFDGLLNGQHFFELCKVQEYVPHQGKKVKQWLVTLELCVDPMEIERYAEPQAVAARSLHALTALTGAVSSAPAPVFSPVPDMSTPAKEYAVAASDDLSPLGPEVEAPPAAAAPATEGEKVDPNILNGRKALNDLMAEQHLFMSDADVLAAQEFGGSMVDDLTYAELRAFYASIQKSIKDRGAAFADDVIAMRAA